MKRIAQNTVRFLVGDDGTTAVEYAMLFLLLFLACLTVITAVGQSNAAGCY